MFYCVLVTLVAAISLTSDVSLTGGWVQAVRFSRSGDKLLWMSQNSGIHLVDGAVDPSRLATPPTSGRPRPFNISPTPEYLSDALPQIKILASISSADICARISRAIKLAEDVDFTY